MSVLRHVSVRGLYGRLDLDVAFHQDVTIVYGKNGSAKTTTLHIVANILSKRFERFSFLNFRFIELSLGTGDTIRVVKSRAQGRRSLIHVELNSKIVVQPFDSQDVVRDLREMELFEEPPEKLQRIREQAKLIPVQAATYFPAFRTTLEAADHYGDHYGSPVTRYREMEIRREPHRRRRESWERVTTEFARDLFGKFVPEINYPSPSRIQKELRDAIREAYFSVAQSDSAILTDAFLDAFAALGRVGVDDSSSETVEELLGEIRESLEQLSVQGPDNNETEHVENVYERLKRTVDELKTKDEFLERGSLVPFLNVYRDALLKRVDAQRQAFREIDRYVHSVNEFLEAKELAYDLGGRTRPSLRVPYLALPGGGRADLTTLSSGERQVVSLLYASMRKRTGEVVLIDEPEISLHIDWQRLLIRKMSSQLQDKQLVVCTHSPEIGSLFMDNMVPMKATDNAIEEPLPEGGKDGEDFEEALDDDDNEVPF